MASDTNKVYSKIWLTDFFHAFQHVSFDFKTVNSTFDPQNDKYLESLGMLCLVPVAVCLLLWLFYIVFFTCRCFSSVTNQSRPRRSSSSARTCVLVLLLFGIAVTGFGFVKNENTHDAVYKVEDALSNINSTITSARTNIFSLYDIADDITGKLSLSLESKISVIPDPNLKKHLLSMIDDIREEADTARTVAKGVDNIEEIHDNINKADDTLDETETYRWIATMVVLIIYILQFVLMVAGLLKSSKTVLVVNAVLGIVLALVFWATVGVYLGASVGLGDFCEDPEAYFARELQDNSALLLTYLECTNPNLPYQTLILEAQASITKASTTISQFTQKTRPYQIPGLNVTVVAMENDLQMALSNLSSILSSVGMCPTIHNFYIDAVTAACVNTLSAVAFLLLITVVLAVVCALIILLVSCVWRHYNKRPTYQYLKQDETDPFLPRPPPPYESEYGSMSRVGSPSPWSERRVLQASAPPPREDQVMFMRQQVVTRSESPPPAYYSGQFTTQYVEAALATSNGRPRHL